MATNNLLSYTGRLYQYIDETQSFVLNPYSNPCLLALSGWDNTTKTIEQLSAEHNGTTKFMGRPDYSGEAQKFPIMILDTGGVISNPTQIKVKCDRDPVLVYAGLTVLGEVDLLEDPENPMQVYYDAPFTVDAGSVYEQLVNQIRLYFLRGVYGVIEKTISFTDPHTGRYSEIMQNIDFREVAYRDPWMDYPDMYAMLFEEADATTTPYIKPNGDTTTLVPTKDTVNPWITDFTVGNMELKELPYIGSAGSSTTGTQHVCWPTKTFRGALASVRPAVSKTKHTWVGSGSKGLFNTRKNWTCKYTYMQPGPYNDATYNSNAAVIAQYDDVLRVYGGVGQDKLLLDLSVYTNRYNVGGSPKFIDAAGVVQTISTVPQNSITGSVHVITHSFDELLNRSTITLYSRPMNLSLTGLFYVGSITVDNPPEYECTKDIDFNAGRSMIASNVTAIGSFSYIPDVALNPQPLQNGQWVGDYAHFFPSILVCGDSWTSLQGATVPGVTGWQSQIMNRYYADLETARFGIFSRGAGDYITDGGGSAPDDAIHPTDWGRITTHTAWPRNAAVSFSNFKYTVNVIRPRAVIFAYTGINYDIIRVNAGSRDWSNPDYNDVGQATVQFSELVWFAREHIKVCDTFEIPYAIVNSVPSNNRFTLQQRMYHPTRPWTYFFAPPIVLDWYNAGLEDPANLGYLLPALASDASHTNDAGYVILGNYTYDHPYVQSTIIPAVQVP